MRGDDNGIATVRALRAIYPELPAILLKATRRLTGCRKGAAGIVLLHKPVAVADLAQAASAILTASGS